MKKAFTLFLCLSLLMIGQAQVSKTFHNTGFLKAIDFKQAGLFGKNQMKTVRHPKIRLSPQSGVIKQCLDSIGEYTIDGSLKIMNYKILFTYDNAGKMTSRVTFYRGVDLPGWTYSYKHEYAYDTAGNMTLDADYNWDETASKWIQNEKHEYIYNTDNQITADINSRLSLDQWINLNKYEYMYDQKGNKTADLYYLWNSTRNFHIINKLEYSYNEFNDLLSIISYPSYVLGIDNKQTKTEYMYDNYRNDTTITTSTWDDSNLSWKITFKTLNTLSYYQNGNVSSKISYSSSIDYKTGLVNLHGKAEYLFDSNGNLLTKTHYTWNATTNSFKNTKKEEYLYDYTCSASDVISGNTFDQFENKTKMITYKVYDFVGSEWHETKEINYFYSAKEVNTAIKNPLAGEVNIFPNPATSSFQINGIEGPCLVTLSDLNGKNLLTKQITGNETLM